MSAVAQDLPSSARSMSLFSRILAGTDGSRGAQECIAQAARLASITGAELELVYVHHPLRSALGPWAEREERISRAERILEQARTIARRFRIEPVTRLLVGEPAQELLREASHRWAGLLCLGPDAPFAEKPHVLGGLVLRVLRDGGVPVLVARSRARTKGAFPHRILCAVDGSSDSFDAVTLSARLASAAGAQLRLLHVVPVTGNKRVGWTVAGEQQGFDPLDPSIAIARRHAVDPAREMALGRPGPAIATAASDAGADLLVLGSRGLRGPQRTFLGSVSDWVARHSDRSVLVVPSIGSTR